MPTFAVTWAWDVLRIQVVYRLIVYAADGVTVVYDSLPQRSSALTATVPAGYLQNNSTYKLAVTATDSASATLVLDDLSSNHLVGVGIGLGYLLRSTA